MTISYTSITKAVDRGRGRPYGWRGLCLVRRSDRLEWPETNEQFLDLPVRDVRAPAPGRIRGP